MRKKLPWFEIALSVVFLSAYIYAACSDSFNLPNRWFIRDDAYYYFKVAQNISEGHGSTFDGIHATNGYHPLWMLICIPIFALARFDLILPLRVLVLVTGLLQIATALLLYRLVRAVISTPVAILAALFWVFNQYVLVFLYKTGVESSVALFFIVLLLTLTMKLERTWRSKAPSARQVGLLAVVAALVVFSRLDLIFFVLIMGIWIILRNSAMRYLLPLDLLAVVTSTLAAFIARLGFPGYYDAATAALAMCVAGALIKLPTFYLLGLYTRPSNLRPASLVGRAVLAVAVDSAALLAGAYLHVLPTILRNTVAYDAAFTLASILMIRFVAGLFQPRREPDPVSTPVKELKTSWKPWLKEGAIFYGIVGGSLGLYMLWNRLAFGSFSPVSGSIKRWWGTFLISVYGGPAQTWPSFFGLNTSGEYNAWAPASTLIRQWSNSLLYGNRAVYLAPPWQQGFVMVFGVTAVIILLILLLTRGTASRSAIQAGMIPLFVGSWLQIFSYNATGYASPKEWYWLSQPILLVLVAALIMNVLIERVLKRWLATRIIVWTIVTGIGLFAAAAYWRDAIALNPYGQTAAGRPYADVVPFLESHTQPGAVIGMTGGGNIGYFIHDRTIVNMDGLINSSEYFQDLKAGTAANYLYDSGMRFVFANPSILKADPYRGQYQGRLVTLDSWGGKDLMKLLPDAGE